MLKNKNSNNLETKQKDLKKNQDDELNKLRIELKE